MKIEYKDLNKDEFESKLLEHQFNLKELFEASRLLEDEINQNMKTLNNE